VVVVDDDDDDDDDDESARVPVSVHEQNYAAFVTTVPQIVIYAIPIPEASVKFPPNFLCSMYHVHFTQTSSCVLSQMKIDHTHANKFYLKYCIHVNNNSEVLPDEFNVAGICTSRNYAQNTSVVVVVVIMIKVR
jgi:hypothetical protein